MSWTIDIPYRSRDDKLVDVAFAGRALPDPESRAVLRELVLEAAIAGDKTAGDLFDRLGRTEPADRRRLLDRLRERVGLPSTSDVEAARRFEAANRALIGRRRLMSADEPPVDEQPRFSRGGGIEIQNRAEIERERRADELREAAFQQRLEERAAEAAAIRRARERYIEQNIDDPIAFPKIAGWPQSRIRSAWSTALHEAAHVGRGDVPSPPRRARATHRRVRPEVGEELGHALIPIDEGIEPDRIVIALAGYAADGRRGWPPAYAKAREEELESLGTTIRVLDIGEEQYEQFVSSPASCSPTSTSSAFATRSLAPWPPSPGLSARTSKRCAKPPAFPSPNVRRSCATSNREDRGRRDHRAWLRSSH